MGYTLEHEITTRSPNRPCLPSPRMAMHGRRPIVAGHLGAAG
jgi:hypothetical protein